MSYADLLQYQAEHGAPVLAAYNFPDRLLIEVTDTANGDQVVYKDVPALFEQKKKTDNLRVPVINNSIKAKQLHLKIPIYHEGSRMCLSAVNRIKVMDRNDIGERTLLLVAEPDDDGIWYQLVCIDESSRAWYMNAERKRIFDDRSLVLCEKTVTGETTLLTLTSDWTARHIHDEQLHNNFWEMEILDSSSITQAIMNKTAIVKVGDDFRFKPIRNQRLGNELGVWQLSLEQI